MGGGLAAARRDGDPAGVASALRFGADLGGLGGAASPPRRLPAPPNPPIAALLSPLAEARRTFGAGSSGAGASAGVGAGFGAASVIRDSPQSLLGAAARARAFAATLRQR